VTTFLSVLREQPASVHFLACCSTLHLLPWYLIPNNVQG
jgi:hypothetical protein